MVGSYGSAWITAMIPHMVNQEVWLFYLCESGDNALAVIGVKVAADG